MSKLLDYLTNRPSATPVNASFEVQATETPTAVAAQPVAPSAAKPKKKFKLIGKKQNKPAVSAQGKNLTVVASSQTPAKVTLKERLSKFRKVQAPQPAKPAMQAKPAIKKTPVKTFLKKPGVKKAAIIGAAAAMPIAAGAYLAIKNRKAIATGAKNVIKKMPKIKLGKKRR